MTPEMVPLKPSHVPPIAIRSGAIAPPDRAAEAVSLLSGEAYLGTGVPACDSRYEIGQVRELFDGLGPVKAAGIASVAVTSPRELGASGAVRTCAAQVGATNAQSYAVVYTVERRDEQILTTIQIR